MSDSVVGNYLSRLVERAGLHRERFFEKKLPNDLENVVVVPFFGGIRQEFIFSSLILNKWKDINRKSYLVVCSWPGHHDLYPYAEEYWCINDTAILQNLVNTSNHFVNTNAAFIERLLLRYLENRQLLFPDDRQFERYYKDGITDTYQREHSGILYSIPNISVHYTELVKSLDLTRKTVFLMPTLQINTWKRQGSVSAAVPKEFWSDLVTETSKNYQTIVYCNYFTHDLSDQKGAVVINDWNIMACLAGMRLSTCVLDVFNQVSKYAYIARVPSLTLDERQRYFGTKDFEIDDLFAKDLPKHYSFSFAPLLNGDYTFVIETVLSQLKNFLSYELPVIPATESIREVSYTNVRKRKSKQMSLRFFHAPRNQEEY